MRGGIRIRPSLPRARAVEGLVLKVLLCLLPDGLLGGSGIVPQACRTEGSATFCRQRDPAGLNLHRPHIYVIEKQSEQQQDGKVKDRVEFELGSKKIISHVKRKTGNQRNTTAVCTAIVRQIIAACWRERLFKTSKKK